MKPIVFVLMCVTLQLSAQESVTEVKRHAFGNPFDPANQDAITMLNRMSPDNEYNVMLFDRWQPMEAEGRDGVLLHIDSANYHISQDKVFFMNKGQLYELFPEKINYITLDKRIFVNLPYEFEDHKVKPRYFEVLEQGEYVLMRMFEIKREVKNDHPMRIAAATEIEFSKDITYYYLKTGNRLPEVLPTNKKDFIMIFRKNRPQMVIYAKENHISLRVEEDLRSIFAYYNRLAEQL